MTKDTPGTAPRRRGWLYLLMVALAACALLVACGDDDDEGSGGGGGGDAAADTSGSSSADAPKGDPIVTYTIADVDTEGPQYKNIAETTRIFESWVNANGGIAGRPLKANFCDAHGTPTDAAACARKAAQDKAVAVVGNFTFTGDAIVPILDKAGISYFGNCCSISPAELNTPSVLSMGSQPVYAAGLIKRAVDDGCKHINAVLIEGAEAFEPLFAASAKALNTKINKVVALPGTARDFSPQVAEATGDGADCLVMIVSETPYIAWMSAFAQSGSDARMYGPQGNLNEKVAKGFEDVTDGDIIAGIYPDISLPQWDDYRKALDQYEADDGQDYNSLGGLGTWAAYSAFKQIVEGISGDIDNKTFLDTAKTAKVDLPGMVPPIDFAKPWSKDGGPPNLPNLYNRCVVFSTLKQGKLEPLTTEFEDMSMLAGGTKPFACS